MARNMSFTLTTWQIREQTKTVTRRKGWQFLKPGETREYHLEIGVLTNADEVKALEERVESLRR